MKMHESFTGVAGKSRAQALKVASHLCVSIPSLIWCPDLKPWCVLSIPFVFNPCKLLSTALFRKSCPAYLLNHQKVRHLKLQSAFERVGLSNYKLLGFFSITAKESYDQIKSGRPSWNSLRSYHHQLFIAVPLPRVTSFSHPQKERSERRPQPLKRTDQHLSSDLLSLCVPT